MVTQKQEHILELIKKLVTLPILKKKKGKYVLVVAEGSFFDGTYESEVFEVGEVLPQPSSNNGLSGGAIAGIIMVLLLRLV